MKTDNQAPQPSDLVAELLTGLATDMSQLKKQLAIPTQQPEPVLVAQLSRIEGQLSSLDTKLATFQSTPPLASTDAFEAHFKQLSFLIKQKPEYKLSQFVWWGGLVFGLMVVLVALLTWKSLEWRGERDQYANLYSQADWRVRYTRQASADYYRFMETKFAQDKGELRQWIIEQEQADQKRALAREAAEQAKALSAQANQLESGSLREERRKGEK